MLSASFRASKLGRFLRVGARSVRTKFSRTSATVKYFREQPNALRGYIRHLWTLGFTDALRRTLKFIVRGGTRQTPVSEAARRKLLLRAHPNRPCIILTTFHCFYIAQAISAALSRVGITSKIIHECPIDGYSDDLHFIICPHTLIHLPRFYIAVQVEQAVNSCCFTSEYVSILKNSIAILDCSPANIKFLKVKGLSLSQIYYLPIDYFCGYKFELDLSGENYDVFLYGDVNNQRQQKFLRELKNHCRVRAINNSTALHDAELGRARLVVNIHDDLNDSLNTVRIRKYLSLHKLVISESAEDMEQHSNLIQLIDFVGIDDVSGMADRVRYWLDNEDLRQERISKNRFLLEKQAMEFDYFFYRFLLATDNIAFDDFWDQVGHKVKLPNDAICLTLPEYIDRSTEFNKDNHFGFTCFQGLRHTHSWLGCAMSYKLIIMLARQQRLPHLVICEDDVEFPADFAERWGDIQNHLNDKNLTWDIFSGLMADLNKNVNIIEAHVYRSQQFLTIDKLISMVFNVYNQRIFDAISQWDETNRDITTNTIDRYLENYGALRVLTTIPFLVAHKESQESTLWGIKNDEYTPQIIASSRLLKEKMGL
jgi:GR25 family glycosyltransferase involved in LPS biosynthesis